MKRHIGAIGSFDADGNLIKAWKNRRACANDLGYTESTITYYVYTHRHGFRTLTESETETLEATWQDVEKNRFDVLERISSLYADKQIYFLQDDGKVYSRDTAETMTVSEAIDEFVERLVDALEV